MIIDTVTVVGAVVVVLIFFNIFLFSKNFVIVFCWFCCLFVCYCILCDWFSRVCPLSKKKGIELFSEVTFVIVLLLLLLRKKELLSQDNFFF